MRMSSLCRRTADCVQPENAASMRLNSMSLTVIVEEEIRLSKCGLQVFGAAMEKKSKRSPDFQKRGCGLGTFDEPSQNFAL